MIEQQQQQEISVFLVNCAYSLCHLIQTVTQVRKQVRSFPLALMAAV